MEPILITLSSLMTGVFGSAYSTKSKKNRADCLFAIKSKTNIRRGYAVFDEVVRLRQTES